MALVVEDGTAKADAEAYISVAACTTYLDKFAQSGTSNLFTAAAADSDREIALRNSARWLDATFQLLYVGHRFTKSQAMQWPRGSGKYNDGWDIDADEMPQSLLDANCEMALRFIEDTTGHDTSRLMPDQANPALIQREKLKADVTEIDTTYVGGAQQQKLYAMAERIMDNILLPAGRIILG